MKKSLTLGILTSLVLLLFATSCATSAINTSTTSATTATTSEERYVTAIFTKEDAQPYSHSSKEKEQLDTIWIYYNDNTFEQFAEHEDKLVAFSNGNYEQVGEEVFSKITIIRTHKYQNEQLLDYSSEHTYDLGPLGFEQIYSYARSGKKIEAIFYGLDRQLLIEEDGDKELLDTIWIYYDDKTFEQFACVEDKMQLFSTGDYEFADGGDFVYEVQEANYGDIIINRHQKYITGKGLVSYESSHTYDLNSLGFIAIVRPQL